jgi:putative mannosyltransferase
MVTCAWVAVNVLRRVVNSELPIQLWHIGPRELGTVEAAMFEPLGVEVVDALELTPTWPARTLGGWELKAYALVHSRFTEVLLLDADNVAVVDPAFLFGTPQFADTGALAWPDTVRFSQDSPIWELSGVPFRDEPAWESGQLLVDKSRCWHALQIALHMNMHSDSFYPYTHGDKDTFHLAWILAGASWAMPDHPARRTATGIYQRDFDGRLVFQHRSTAKWQFTGSNLHAAEFRHEAECLRFIEELRDHWSGRIDALPPRSPADGAIEDRVAEMRWFSLEQPGADRRLLELLPGNRVGIGSSRNDALRWYVRDGVMVIGGTDGGLPPLSRERGQPLTFSTIDGELEACLEPTPEAGLDAVGVTAAAVIDRFADQGAITEDDAVATLATLAQVGQLADALDRARSRWQHSADALRLIERAARRIGLGKAMVDLELPGYELRE